MNKLNILGINISTLNKNQVLSKIEQFLDNRPSSTIEANKFHYLVTPNPEIILSAKDDEELFYILNHADIAIPDGVGLWFAGINLGVSLHRYTGIDLVKDILEKSEKNLKILVLNWQGGLSKKAHLDSALNKLYPRHIFEIFDTDRQGRGVDWERVKKYNPQLVLVTLGSPYQEKLIVHEIRNNLPNSVAIGIGGALDFITGKIKRSPRILRILGLEWVWRVFNQPRGRKLWRLKRIYQASIVFPIKFIKWRYILPFFYRPNVASLIYKKVDNTYKIFLVERAGEPGHWQILQGGTDGLSIEDAGYKEAHEEMNTKKINTIATFKNLHCYKFPDETPKHRGAEYKKHTGYKGQRQSLYIGEFVGGFDEVKIDYWDHVNSKWVDVSEVIDIVHPLRREATQKYLDKFNSLQITN